MNEKKNIDMTSIMVATFLYMFINELLRYVFIGRCPSIYLLIYLMTNSAKGIDNKTDVICDSH